MATPSLAMIPSAYADSKVYSVLPNNGDGDFTFNRDSSATRVGQNGLIQEVGFFGNELVVNGDFATDTDWSKDSNWSISGGSANADGTSSNNISQASVTPTVGKTYKVIFEVLSISQGYFQARLGNALGVQANNVGVHTSYVTATTTDRVRIYASSSGIGSIDNVSVKEVTGDQPRLNYDISNGVVQSCPSLLLEPASTNLVLNSATGAYGNGPGSELITTAPDGTNTAIIPIPNSTSDRYQETITGGTYATGTKLTYSWYSKQISVPVGTFVGNLKVQILVNATQVGANIKVKDSINGWAKYSATFNITDGSLQSIIRLYFGNVILTGNQSVAYWGHQLEALPYCTSLIPTDGSSQTRAAETCFGAGNDQVINSEKGCFYFEGNVFKGDDTVNIISITDGSINNYIYLNFQTNTNQEKVRYTVAGNTQINYNFPSSETMYANSKYAISYKTNEIKVYRNGVEIITDTNAVMLSPNTLNTIQFSFNNTDYFKGHIKDLRLYNEALTDAQLQTLTTL